jgi:hypothetical protein
MSTQCLSRIPLSPLAIAALVLALAPLSSAESKSPKTPGPDAKIQWFGTWEDAAAEAKRTGRPILLTAAAPQCKGTPGIW